MPRVKRGFKARRRRKKILKLAKGYRGARSRQYRAAVHSVGRALAYAFRDRRARKRDFRKLWIARINAGTRANGMNYNRFIHGLSEANVALDRKILADIALHDPDCFKALVDQARA